MEPQQQNPPALEYASADQPGRAHGHWKDTLLALFAGAIIAATLILPSLPGPRRASQRTACSANLKAIATSCLVYAEGNKHQLPASLDVLTTGGSRAYLQPKQLVCPTTGKPYLYVANLMNDDDPRLPVVFEPLGNHADGANVAFLDGHAKWCLKTEYLSLFRKAQSRPAQTGPAGSGAP